MDSLVEMTFRFHLEDKEFSLEREEAIQIWLLLEEIFGQDREKPSTAPCEVCNQTVIKPS